MTAEFYRELPTKRIGAGVLFSDVSGRVLLVEPTYKDSWEIPGGLVEAGESPLTAARREVGEELGLECGSLRLWCIDWHPAAAPRTEGLMLVFDGGVLSPAPIFALPPAELRSAKFCDLAEAESRLAPGLFLRVASCLASPGGTVYLEHGVSPAAQG